MESVSCASRKGYETCAVHFRHEVNLPGTIAVRADLRDPDEAANLFRELRPEAVIHAAAISDADFCETHRSESHGINVEAPAHLASLCRARSIPYLFTSSDLVFDGLAPPYREEDPPHPRSHYGEQKVRAEKAILSAYPDAAVCRLPLMIGIPGPGGKGVLPMLQAMTRGKPLRLFCDEFRTPLTARSAAAGIATALGQVHGKLHLGGPERISRHDLGRLIARVFELRGAVLVPSRQRDVATDAPRPPDVSLDSGLAFGLGFRPPPLLEQLRELRAEYIHCAGRPGAWKAG